MNRKKIILALILAATAGICYAQKKYVLPPPKVITHNFTAPELRVNSAFIDRLNTILFDENRSAVSDKSSRNFYIGFEQNDSLNYFLQVSLGEDPSRKSTGFFEHNEYLYWFYADVPPGIILETTKLEKHFSYKELITAVADVYDPMIWFLTYNRKTGEIKEVPF